MASESSNVHITSGVVCLDKSDSTRAIERFAREAEVYAEIT